MSAQPTNIGPPLRSDSPLKSVVIVPAFNEAASLPDVLRDLAPLGFDVVVVDDGSTDATAALAREQGAVVLRMPINVGIGGALRCGFQWASSHGYERAVQLDADGQHDPAQIPLLFAELDAGADLVIGSRFAGDDSGYRIPPIRRVAMRILEGAVRLVIHRRFTDTSSGFRAFSGPMIEYFAGEYPADYMESVEALCLASVAGFEVTEVAITMRPRSGGSASVVGIRLLFHYLRVLLAVTVRVRAGRGVDMRARA